MPDAPRLLADLLGEMDAAAGTGLPRTAVLGVLADGARQLSGATAVAVLARPDGRWVVEAGAGQVSAADGVSPSCDTVVREGRPSSCREPADAAVQALGAPVRLLPVLGLGVVVAVLALTPEDPAEPGHPALVEALARHAGLHVARLDDAALHEDLLAQRATAMGALARMADTDSLTGTANRAGLFRVLGSLSGRGQQAAVVMLDLDRFKEVNDTSGHAAGDELLCQVAGRLLACVRPTDVVGRLGGDEFLVVARDADDAAVQALVSRIGRAFSEPFVLSTGAVATSASCGWAVSSGHRSVGELLNAADRMMYERKHADRATVSLPDPPSVVVDLHREGHRPLRR